MLMLELMPEVEGIVSMIWYEVESLEENVE